MSDKLELERALSILQLDSSCFVDRISAYKQLSEAIQELDELKNRIVKMSFSVRQSSRISGIAGYSKIMKREVAENLAYRVVEEMEFEEIKDDNRFETTFIGKIMVLKKKKVKEND